MLTRKLTSLILCSAIALAFAGCGSAPAVSATSGPSENTADNTADSTTESTADSTAEAPAPDNSKDEFVSEYAAFKVTSPNLNGGKWDDKIGERAEAKGVSPALSWDPVEGASCYAIYMVDLDTHYFLHWVQGDITETSLAEGGAAPGKYIGPYPEPGSTHRYNIYVIALKNPVERVKGGSNSINPKFPEFIKALDTDASGNTGNIISVGRVCGTYTA